MAWRVWLTVHVVLLVPHNSLLSDFLRWTNRCTVEVQLYKAKKLLAWLFKIYLMLKTSALLYARLSGLLVFLSACVG